MNLALLDSRLVVAVIAGVLGFILALLTQRILGKRGLFTYFVWHNRLGVSADDAIFGSVRVTWNDNPVANLYSSTVELRNESFNDYDNVVVRVFTNDTFLLTERTDIVGTTHFLNWTDEFSNRLVVQPGTQPTIAQQNLYRSQRDYLVPTMNRGQIVRFTFLNAPTSDKPSLWLDILHKGVRLKFRLAQTQFLGVPQPAAALVGAALSLVVLAVVVSLVDSV
ncbi:MAG TPA: hypothetical protein VGK99_04950 [Acidobacteriota bacterium]|jgi:hypothetical protein